MTKHKGIWISAGLGLGIVALLWLLFSGSLAPRPAAGQEPAVSFRTQGKEIQILRGGSWETFQMKGVNMGTGYPGLFPNEFGIEEDTYYRWFCQIADMNANTVRVYKLQSPDFYSALLRYNKEHPDRPLYLVQGMDFPEQLIYSEKNLLDKQVHKKLFDDTRNMIDALHGDLADLSGSDDLLSIYPTDISDYVLGYILGIEWDELYVEYTARINDTVRGYEGQYLTCGSDANAFEAFLALWGDLVLSHETEKYGTQRLISFCNWPDTDPFLNELDLYSQGGQWQKPRETPVDVERIHLTDQVKSGLFASYNVYPYFPSFLQYGQYTGFVDENGDQNPYQGYLTTLAGYHKCPVIIAEYGIPASRSRAYGEVWRGINHGGLSESAQGRAMATLYEDICQSGCAGSIAFTWQDEWYKTIWNEKLISDPDKRAFWSNAQCAEQFFGLLTFEPGEAGSTCYPDGHLDDWDEEDLILDNGSTRLSIQQDEKYLYFLAEGLDERDGNHLVNIALDLSPSFGHADCGCIRFRQPVDFIIQIDTLGESCLYVDREYDLLPYSALGGYRDSTYGSMVNLMSAPHYRLKEMRESSDFVVVSRADGDIYSRLAANWIINPVGKLVQGSTDPYSPDYASNADYFVSGDFVEIRIPWQLLNFRDPSQSIIVDNHAENYYELEELQIRELYAAPYYDDWNEPVSFGTYKPERWKTPSFHERLKESYYIMQEAFAQNG